MVNPCIEHHLHIVTQRHRTNCTRLDAQCLVENNYFENVNNPWEQYITSGTPGLLYATGKGTLWVGLFAQSETTVKLDGDDLRVKVETRYPWNGDVRLSPTPEQWDPTPQYGTRTIDSTSGRIAASLAYPAHGFRYRIEAQPSGAGVLVRVVLDAPLPKALEGRAGFNLEFLPSAYFGKAYVADGRPGMLPRRESGRTMHSLSVTEPGSNHHPSMKW